MARGPGQAAPRAANDQRRAVYLPDLSEEQVKASLSALNRLRAVAPAAGQLDVWQAVEDFGRV